MRLDASGEESKRDLNMGLNYQCTLVVCVGLEVRWRGILVCRRNFGRFGGLGYRVCKNEASGVFLFVFFLDFEEFGAGLLELAAEAVAVEAEVGDGSHHEF